MISRLLMILGAILLGFGFFMDNTVPCNDYSDDRCLNMFKQAEQTRYLITGGIVLLAGILLFGFHRLKQTADDEKREREADDEAERRVAEKAKGIRKTLGELIAALRSPFADSNDQIGSRLAVGVAVAVWLVVVFSEAMWVFDVEKFLIPPLLVGVTLSALRKGNADKIKKQLLTVCVGVTALAVIYQFARVWNLRTRLAEYSIDDTRYPEFVWVVIGAERQLGVVVGGLLVFGMALLFVVRAARRELDYH